MALEVLAALPALHATFIGVIGAIYSVFVMYGYQKVQEARELLESANQSLMAKLSKVIKSAVASRFLYEDSGSFSLKRAENILTAASGAFISRNGVLAPEADRVPPEEFRMEFERLMTLLVSVSNSYPFVIPSGIEDENVAYHENRLVDLQAWIELFAEEWSRNSVSLQRLAIAADKLETDTPTAEYFDASVANVINQFSRRGMLSDGLRDEYVRFHTMRPELGYEKFVVDFFETMVSCRESVAPEISKALQSTKKCFFGYAPMLHARIILIIGVALLVFGVLLPLSIISLKPIFSWELPVTWEFWIFVYSFVPYLIGVTYLWSLLGSRKNNKGAHS